MSRIYTSIHGADNEPIRAAASGHEDTTWLSVFVGDVELTFFMPLDRAERLAVAITAAEAEQRAADDAAADEIPF